MNLDLDLSSDLTDSELWASNILPRPASSRSQSSKVGGVVPSHLAANDDSAVLDLRYQNSRDRGQSNNDGDVIPGPHLPANGPTGELNDYGIHNNSIGRRPKRKATDLELRSGKRLVDTYSKRSKNLIKKGEELEELSHAYVVIYTARPESVGGDRHRLFTSDSFKSVDPALTQRLKKATEEINSIAIECARFSGNEVRQRKQTHDDPGNANNNDLVTNSKTIGEANRKGALAHARAVHAPCMSITPFVYDYSTPDEWSPRQRPCIISGTGVSSFASGISAPTCATCCSLDKNEVVSLVNRLLDHSRDIQLSALNDIENLILSDHGVQVACENMAATHLVGFLDRNIESNLRVAILSLKIVFQLSLYQTSCTEMVQAGILRSLNRFFSSPTSDKISDKTLALVVETMGHCAIQHRYILDTSTLFPHDILTPLVNLLYCNEQGLIRSALNAITNIALSGAKISRQLWVEDIVPQLCHLASQTRSLMILERIALALGRIVHDDIIDPHRRLLSIENHVLRPLLSFLCHESTAIRSGACRALRWLSNSAPLVHDFKVAIISPLIPLLSEENDELFAEAISATIPWTYKRGGNSIGTDGGEHFDLEMVRRLIRLLSSGDGHLEACAARAIGQFSGHCWESDEEIAETMDELDGTKRLVELLYSKNPITVLKAADAIFHLEFAPKNLVRHGVIPALFHAIGRGFHSYTILQPGFKAIANLANYIFKIDPEVSNVTAFIRAGAIPCTMRIMALETGSFRLAGYICLMLKFLCSSYNGRNALIEAGVALPLMQLVQKLLKLYDSAEILEFVVLPLVRHSRQEFKRVGAESVLSDIVQLPMDGCPDYLQKSWREYASKALDLLRGEGDYESE